MRILRTLISVALVVTAYRVYDAQGRLTEVWKDRGEVIDIYDNEMARKGFIRKETNQWSRYDSEWNRETTIERADRGPVTIDRIEK